MDGPGLGVDRHACNFKHMSLTDIVVPVARGARKTQLTKVLTEEKVEEKWEATAWAKKLKARATRATLTDFDRFVVKVTKQKRNRAVRAEYRKLKKA